MSPEYVALLMQTYPTKRAEALKLGALHYFTGKHCKNGHLALRNAQYGDCLDCKREYLTNWRADNPADSYAVTKRWRAKNRARYLAQKRAHYEENRDVVKAHRRMYYITHRAKAVAVIKAWQLRNPDRLRHYASARRAAKLQRTPTWADPGAIADFYANCPDGHEVDHIIPLQGKFVSGLHVLNNLQYLTKEANRKKLNSFDPWTFEA